VVTPTEGLTVLSLLNSESPVQPRVTDVSPPFDHRVQPNTSHPDETLTFVYQQAPREPILWPLEVEQEAMLLQHYIENVALFVCSCKSVAEPLLMRAVRHDRQ